MKSEEKEPQSFSDFASATLARLRDQMRRFVLSRNEIPADDLARLQEKASRGARIRAFMSSDVWVHDLEPFISEEIRKCQMRPWRPGEPYSAEAFSTEHKFMSGVDRGLGLPLSQMRTWVEEGNAAVARLKELSARRKASEKKL